MKPWLRFFCATVELVPSKSTTLVALVPPMTPRICELPTATSFTPLKPGTAAQVVPVNA